MIDLVGDEFVPVWVNIRTTPVPDLPCMEEILNGVQLDETRRVAGGWSRKFFLRSVVLASDGVTLLNRQPPATFAYAQVKADDYLRILEESLTRQASLNREESR